MDMAMSQAGSGGVFKRTASESDFYQLFSQLHPLPNEPGI